MVQGGRSLGFITHIPKATLGMGQGHVGPPSVTSKSLLMGRLSNYQHVPKSSLPHLQTILHMLDIYIYLYIWEDWRRLISPISPAQLYLSAQPLARPTHAGRAKLSSSHETKHLMSFSESEMHTLCAAQRTGFALQGTRLLAINNRNLSSFDLRNVVGISFTFNCLMSF